MPTPVSVARQCLTAEAAQALDEAVSVARRRGHAQTTSLHAVSALLSLQAPSSALRDACSRARNSAYSARLQLKALEFCLGVSLDRVTSSAAADDPPVSNSLMAAIKRSQANQRRQPENYHHHQIQQQTTVKVELQHLTLSILDDPLVSRVFGEAGFRSSEIKLAILRPFSQLLRYSRFRGPPVFLCNLSEYPTRTPFGFLDGNSRRIGEILGRSKGRNPLLVGVCAYDALQNFADSVEKRNDAVLPPGLSSLRMVSIEREVLKSVGEDSFKGFGDLRETIERSTSGVVVNLGDLKALVSGDAASSGCVVGEMTRVMEVEGRKVWLIGATASYESYLKLVSRFPSIEKDWDLQLLPITSLTSNSSSSMAESYPRSRLMESFVPFGGLYSEHSESWVEMATVDHHLQTKDDLLLSNNNAKESSACLFKGIFERVNGRQWEAVSLISRAIERRARWVSLSGPDSFTKKKIASALSHLLSKTLISLDLTHTHTFITRGNNVVDFLAREISNKPSSLVFLHNLHHSDLLLRRSFSHAISTAKFPDSYGRQVSTTNTIFLTTCDTLPKDKFPPSNYSEDRISATKGRPIRILLHRASTQLPASSTTKIVFNNKRNPDTTHDLPPSPKRPNSARLDLNLPAEDDGEAWLQELFDQSDETVVFKPVEFEAMAEKILKEINEVFRKSIPRRACLEIDSEVMEQLLAATYMSDDRDDNVVDDWIHATLRKGLERRIQTLDDDEYCVLKLVAASDSEALEVELELEDQLPQSIYLPTRIILN